MSVPRHVAASKPTSGASEPAVARYLQVARSLEHSIANGVYQVGSLIPTENELAVEFRVSRQTVRQAIAHLRSRQLLSARKGVGTRVEAVNPTLGFYHAIQSLTELFRFAEATVLRVDSTEWVTASGALAIELGCRAGRRWLRLDGVREQVGALVPLGDMTVFVDERYAGFLTEPRAHSTAIFSQIEDRFGEAIVEVDQHIEATVLDEAAAARLHAAPGSPALLVTRRYLAAGRRLVELSRTLHPADRFRYAMTLRRH